MLEKVWKWLGSGGSREEEDLKMFFEETTGMCFKECVKPAKYSIFSKKSLTDKEKKCIQKCTLRKIDSFLEIEEELAKIFHKRE